MSSTSETTPSGPRGSRDALRRVLANPSLRRIQLAFAGSLLGDTAYATAVAVWAYSQGGATAVGVFAAVRMLVMAVFGNLGAVVADRVPRRTFMLAADAIRLVLVAAAALAITVGLPALVVYGLAVLTAIVGAPFRSAQAGLIPKLVAEPAELTASNAVAANLENVVTFVGPALGALLLGLADVPTVYWLDAATFVWSFAMVLGVRLPAAEVDAPATTPQEAGDDAEPGFLREVSAGFTHVLRDRDLSVVSALVAMQGLIWGALMVFLVSLAARTLGAGASGLGYYMSVIGVGTIVGGIVVLARSARGRLGEDMAFGVLGWSLPLLLMATYLSPVTTFAGLAVIGLLDPFVNVGLETIPQRITPDHLISRVYAAVESALIGAMALGAALAPLLLRTLGLRPSLVALGALGVLVVAVCFPRVRRLDRRLAPPAELPLLRSIALFSPLSPPVVESLARSLERVEVPAGTAVVAEGEISDLFYVIESGTVEVTQGGRRLREEGPGEFFGEIGLLRDVPRTATVTATTDTVLLALARAPFLDAVTGQQDARLAADEVVTRRLAV